MHFLIVYEQRVNQALLALNLFMLTQVAIPEHLQFKFLATFVAITLTVLSVTMYTEKKAEPPHQEIIHHEPVTQVEGQKAPGTKSAGRDELNDDQIRRYCLKFQTINSTPKVKPWMFEKVRLLEFHDPDSGRRQWLCFNGHLGQLTVKLDFKDCVNYDLSALRGGECLTDAEVVVAPFSCCMIADIHIADLYQASSFSMRSSASLSPPDENFRAAEAKRVADEVKAFERIGRKFTDKTSFEAIIKACQAANRKFCDTKWPANRQAICGDEDPHPYPDVQWQRPEDIMEDDPLTDLDDLELFKGIDPYDINQGRLGDCWFLCALSALAETPRLVQRLFRNKAMNPEGVYQLRVVRAGRPVCVTVDDFFPCGSNGPMFSKNHGNELWVLLLEKAYAKMHGCYTALRGGTPAEALADLTGYPIEYHDFADITSQEREHLWSRMKDWGEDDQLMCAGTPGEDTYTERGLPSSEEGGLVPGHAYTILNAAEVRLSNGGTEKLLNLRNPWGQFEWDGDWSDNSSLWTDDVKRQLNIREEFSDDDGAFWMSFEDFMTYFDSITTCYRYDEDQKTWKSTRANGTIIQDIKTKEVSFSNVMTMDLDQKETLCWFGVHQPNERFKDSDHYVDLGLVVLAEDGSIAHLSDVMTKSSNWSPVTLPPGRYTVMPFSTATQVNKFSNLTSNSEYQVCCFSNNRRAKFVLHEWDDTLYQHAMGAIAHTGATKDLPYGLKLLSKTSPHAPIFTYAAYLPPTEQGRRTVTMAVANSTNITSHRRVKSYQQSVNPGETVIFHHLGPIERFEGCSVSMSFRVGRS